MLWLTELTSAPDRHLLKRICLLDTSAFSALAVLDDYCVNISLLNYLPDVQTSLLCYWTEYSYMYINRTVYLARTRHRKVKHFWHRFINLKLNISGNRYTNKNYYRHLYYVACAFVICLIKYLLTYLLTWNSNVERVLHSHGVYENL